MLKIIKRIFIFFFVFVIFSFFIWLGYLVRGGRDPVVLMYHSIGEPLKEESLLDVSEDAFQKQMSFLRDGGYHVVSLLDLADLISRNKAIPFKTVVITFDDGFENNYTKAYPILKKYNFPATIFMITGYIGRQKEMLGHRYGFLNKEMLLELSEGGLVTIGSHTKSHPYLPDCKNVYELDDEISGSKKELENILKKPVETFAYPIGGYNEDVVECVKNAGFRIAVTTLSLKKNPKSFNIHALKRVKMTERSKNPFVFFVETSGYYIRMKEARW